MKWMLTSEVKSQPCLDTELSCCFHNYIDSLSRTSHEKAMSELRRSIGKLILSPECWLSKIFLLFYMCLVGLTTVNKLHKFFFTIIILFFHDKLQYIIDFVCLNQLSPHALLIMFCIFSSLSPCTSWKISIINNNINPMQFMERVIRFYMDGAIRFQDGWV